jgi:hypothetical protein
MAANWAKRNKWKKQLEQKQRDGDKNPFRSTKSLKQQLEWLEERVVAEEKLDRDFGWSLVCALPLS